MHDNSRGAHKRAIVENRLAAKLGGFSTSDAFIEGETHQRPTHALARYFLERRFSDEVFWFGQVD
jgi:hypothetical protein